jgi:hypothetical protein
MGIGRVRCARNLSASLSALCFSGQGAFGTFLLAFFPYGGDERVRAAEDRPAGWAGCRGRRISVDGL